jgi:hypothetical protein
VKTYGDDLKTSRAPEEGAHSPSWPNGLVIIVIITSEHESASLSPSQLNGLIIIIIINI